MKTFTILFLMLLSLATTAQTPNGFSYQAVIRNSNGELIKNQIIGMQISILQGSENGSAVYIEIQTPMTNNNGLATTEIGIGDSSGFAAINWAEGPYFLKIETDPNGGTDYSISGTSQLLSVPYALYAKQAGNMENINLMPSVFTNTVSLVSTNSALCGGNIVANGSTEITERGVCWSVRQNPTIADSVSSDGTTPGFYTSEISGLTPGVTYYIRAYATNSSGTSYGNQVILKTPLNVVFPTVTTIAVTNITSNAATSGGNIIATGGGEITARGVCWSDHQNPTISDSKTEDGNGNGQFQSQISGLLPGTFYVRAYATNRSGTGYGNSVTFTTEKTLPVLTTKNISNISAMGAVSGGAISSSGGGKISQRGICWSDSPNPTIENEKAISPATSSSFSAAIAKASPNTTYYLRAYASNEIGTGYGDEKTFATSEAAYHTSFETGLTPIGWSGPFTVTSEMAFEGSYSFKSLTAQDNSTTLTINLSDNGQIYFYYAFNDGLYIDLYIDNDKISTYSNDGSGWRLGTAPISSGHHTIKWVFKHHARSNKHYGKCYIDQITITK